MLFAWIFGFSLLGSVGALAGGVVLLAFPDAIRKRLLPYLVSYASGTLLGAAFLGMIPAGIRQAPVPVVMFAVLAVAAASFIYISMADLIPGLHRRASLRSAGQQIILLMLGIATIAVIHAVSNP